MSHSTPSSTYVRSLAQTNLMMVLCVTDMLRKVKRFSYDFMVCFVNTLDSWVTKKDLSRDFCKLRRKRKYNWFPRRLAARDRYRIHIKAATSKQNANVHKNQEPFCTDGCPVGIDNRASACISHQIGDFVGPLTS